MQPIQVRRTIYPERPYVLIKHANDKLKSATVLRLYGMEQVMQVMRLYGWQGAFFNETDCRPHFNWTHSIMWEPAGVVPNDHKTFVFWGCEDQSEDHPDNAPRGVLFRVRPVDDGFVYAEQHYPNFDTPYGEFKGIVRKWWYNSGHFDNWLTAKVAPWTCQTMYYGAGAGGAMVTLGGLDIHSPLTDEDSPRRIFERDYPDKQEWNDWMEAVELLHQATNKFAMPSYPYPR